MVGGLVGRDGRVTGQLPPGLRRQHQDFLDEHAAGHLVRPGDLVERFGQLPAGQRILGDRGVRAAELGRKARVVRRSTARSDQRKQLRGLVPTRRTGELLDVGDRSREFLVLPPVGRTRPVGAQRARVPWSCDALILDPIVPSRGPTAVERNGVPGAGSVSASVVSPALPVACCSSTRKESTRGQPAPHRHPDDLQAGQTGAHRARRAGPLAVLWFQFVSIYVNFLWYGEVGFRGVFTTEALTRILLFLSPAVCSPEGWSSSPCSSPTDLARSSCRPPTRSIHWRPTGRW